MGFLTSATGTTITAKLTPYGRQQLLANNSSIITKFSLGDSDANYLGDLPLGSGQVPDMAGEIGANNLFSNGVYTGVKIKSTIQVNSTGVTKKNVQGGSTSVVITPKTLGVTALTSTDLTTLVTDRTQGDTDPYANLFYSFGLPITQAQKDLYTTFTTNFGNGYLDTAIRNLNQDKILVLAIDKCDYGELIDGKTVKVEISGLTGTTSSYTMYSTFQKSNTPLTTLDAQLKEVLSQGTAIGDNVAFLFSDSVARPNSNPAKSWATGYNTVKPFSLNNKELFNEKAVTSTGTKVDWAVGVAYLAKGIIVITHPDIVNGWSPAASSATTITFNSISNEVAQNVTCIVERDEFAVSNNATYTSGDLIRISEIALYDDFNNVIAFAKSNEHILIGANQFMAIGVRILV